MWRPLLEEAGFGIDAIPKTQDASYDFFQAEQDKPRSKGKRIYGLGYSMATRDGDSNTLFNAFLIAYGGAGIVSPDGALHLDAKVRAAANPMGWQIALKSPVLLPNRYQHIVA